MKHSLFSILFMASALAYLPSVNEVFSTGFHTGKPTLVSSANAQLTNEAGSLSCGLPAPGSFNGERTSGTTASLSWNTVTGAVAYRLIVQNLSTDEVLSSTLEYGNSKNLSGLEHNTAYRCSLAPVCSNGETGDFIIIIVDILD